jgi:hypothetical protein
LPRREKQKKGKEREREREREQFMQINLFYDPSVANALRISMQFCFVSKIPLMDSVLAPAAKPQ